MKQIASKQKKAIMVFLMLVAALGTLSAQDSFQITFVNDTGYDISSLYISPSMSDDWHEDLLAGDSIRNGEQSMVEVPVVQDDAQYYDILAVDVDGDRYSRYEVALSERGERSVTFTFDDFDDSGSSTNTEADDRYNQGYLDGYREAWREAYKEAYSEGYRSGLEDAEDLQEEREQQKRY